MKGDPRLPFFSMVMTAHWIALLMVTVAAGLLHAYGVRKDDVFRHHEER